MLCSFILCYLKRSEFQNRFTLATFGKFLNDLDEFFFSLNDELLSDSQKVAKKLKNWWENGLFCNSGPKWRLQILCIKKLYKYYYPFQNMLLCCHSCETCLEVLMKFILFLQLSRFFGVLHFLLRTHSAELFILIFKTFITYYFFFNIVLFEMFNYII